MATATTEKDLLGRMDKLEELLEKAASKPAASASPANVFGFGGFEQTKANDWPIERLKALGGSYASETALNLYGKRRNGQMRLSGMGPALVRLAGMCGQNDAKSIARSQGMADSYGEDNFEEEFGFVTVAKAASKGVPGYDRANRKVLLNERRKVALAEGSGQTGGYIVPPQFISELLTIAAEDGFIEQRAKILPMNSRTATWPTLDITTAQATGVSPYFGGIVANWQPEAATITESEPTFRQTEWVAWDLVLYTVSSNQLLMDNGIGLDALLMQLFGQAMTWYKEYAYLRGVGAGSSMPMGIINAPATYVQSRAVTSRFTYADAAAMMSRLQVRSWDDACWIMHQSVLPQLIQMVDGGTSNTASTTYIPGNRLVWVNPTMTGKNGPAGEKLPTAFLNGLPIFFTEKLPSLGTKGDVMLVDLSHYVIGLRMDTQIDVSPHVAFRTNQLAWRVICRADGRPWLNNVITDASGFQISPFVVLNA